MKNLIFLFNNVIILLLSSLPNYYYSQTKQNDLKDININWIVDNYIDFYAKRIPNFNFRENYIMLSINDDTLKKQTYLYILDNCYRCPGVENTNYLILLYRDYRIVIATDSVKNKDMILRNFRKASVGKHFKVIPYNVDVTYHSPRQWRFIYDDKATPIFFCNSRLDELGETKKLLFMNSYIDDCSPNL